MNYKYVTVLCEGSSEERFVKAEMIGMEKMLTECVHFASWVDVLKSVEK